MLRPHENLWKQDRILYKEKYNKVYSYPLYSVQLIIINSIEY